MGEPAVVGREEWTKWILEAIRKIRSQKQRPSVERICHAIRQHHNFHEDVVGENLDYAVKAGSVLKVYNKGQSSYKDPGGCQSKTLRIGKGVDLCKIFSRSVRELGERDGSNVKSVEKYLYQTYNVVLEEGVDLKQLLRIASKRAIARGFVTQHGKVYKSTDRPLTGMSPVSTPTAKFKKEKKRATLESPESKVFVLTFTLFYYI